MGQNISELISRFEASEKELVDLLASDEATSEETVLQLDRLGSETLSEILTAELVSEKDIRTRIEFIVRQIDFHADGNQTITRLVELLCSNFEQILSAT